MNNKRNYVILILYIASINILIVGALILAKIACIILVPQYHYIVRSLLYTFLICLFLIIITIEFIKNDITHMKKQ